MSRSDHSAKAPKNNTYQQYEPKGEWWTAPVQGDSGGLVMVTGRADVDKFRDNPRFSIRVDIAWIYDAIGKAMPAKDTADELQKITQRLQRTFDSDPVAVMTGIYTGEGRRDWVFYTLSTNIFGRKLNEALADLPLYPLEITCENDPGWEEYTEMRSLTELTASDE